MASENDVHKLLSRSLLLKSAYTFMYVADSYNVLREEIELHKADFEVANFDDLEQSFCVKVQPTGRKKGINCLKTAEEIAAILPLDRAPVDLVNPYNTFTVLEEYLDVKSEPSRLVFCRLVGHGQYKLKSWYDIKKRRYIGNTTMDPELAFIQSNISSVKDGDLVLDPFMGTGGLLLPAAHFGAYVIGTEINYRVAKAQGKSSRHDVIMRSEMESVLANFEQYGIQRYYLCGLLADASWHDIWERPLFNVIVTDPPYGIREKGRKVGKKPRKEQWTLPDTQHECHYPEKTPYSLENTFTDVCNLAAKILLVGGKLSFWFPVVLESISREISTLKVTRKPACLFIQRSNFWLTVSSGCPPKRAAGHDKGYGRYMRKCMY
ncbi:hypothetical protein NECAME_08109 [Necator americanus]|uniref:tRNA (guanine(10)-N(2))-methyltransferase TRMT11 n=1 Tax=Necator americanus TaxID=51031 RepID=W2TJA6_NECAM|nr:hypothetical protein NECAME_08109 [Necator americanus]ETN82180.1 hypothetical protein NECAME_08109 [Necator americanus]